MPKNKCLFQAKSLDDPRYSQWLRKTSDEVALCSYCKSCYVFNIWYRCFYVYKYCTVLLKALSFIDLNPLGANRDKWGIVSPHIGEISIFTLVFPTSCIKSINVNFDCLYLYYIGRHAFHFLTLFVFKLFYFGNIWSDTHLQYPVAS